ncbi:hypothetical protein QF030_003989 [Streptomyces rishiriensis]|uniref:Uncharacterized protein n=1 Tax=Streptomyces rishiriensis TaxID=68264 RepID=A0ABU0NRL6_STRRH|nr:hypothetical protein [Streptomyces rishiriensis]
MWLSAVQLGNPVLIHGSGVFSLRPTPDKKQPMCAPLSWLLRLM